MIKFQTSIKNQISGHVNFNSSVTVMHTDDKMGNLRSVPKQHLQPPGSWEAEDENGNVVETCNKTGIQRYCQNCGNPTQVRCNTHDPEYCDNCLPADRIIN